MPKAAKRPGLTQALGGMTQAPRLLIESKNAESVVAGIGTPCEITYGEPSNNSSVRYDFEFPHAMARFTWWSDSGYVSESLAIDGRRIVSTHGSALDASAATRAIQNLLAATELAAAT